MKCACKKGRDGLYEVCGLHAGWLNRKLEPLKFQRLVMLKLLERVEDKLPCGPLRGEVFEMCRAIRDICNREKLSE